MNIELKNLVRFELLKNRIKSLGQEPGRACFLMNPGRFWLEYYLPYLNFTYKGLTLEDDDSEYYAGGSKPGSLRRASYALWESSEADESDKKTAQDELKRMFPNGTVPVDDEVMRTVLEFLSFGLLKFN